MAYRLEKTCPVTLPVSTTDHFLINASFDNGRLSKTMLRSSSFEMSIASKRSRARKRLGWIVLLVLFLGCAASSGPDCLTGSEFGSLFQVCDYAATPIEIEVSSSYCTRTVSPMGETFKTNRVCIALGIFKTIRSSICKTVKLCSWTERYFFGANQFGRTVENKRTSESECIVAPVKRDLSDSDYPSYEWSSGYDRQTKCQEVILKDDLVISVDGLCSFYCAQLGNIQVISGQAVDDRNLYFDMICEPIMLSPPLALIDKNVVDFATGTVSPLTLGTWNATWFKITSNLICNSSIVQPIQGVPSTNKTAYQIYNELQLSFLSSEFAYNSCLDGTARKAATSIPGALWSGNSSVLLKWPCRSYQADLICSVNSTLAACTNGRECVNITQSGELVARPTSVIRLPLSSNRSIVVSGSIVSIMERRQYDLSSIYELLAFSPSLAMPSFEEMLNLSMSWQNVPQLRSEFLKSNETRYSSGVTPSSTGLLSSLISALTWFSTAIFAPISMLVTILITAAFIYRWIRRKCESRRVHLKTSYLEPEVSIGL